MPWLRELAVAGGEVWFKAGGEEDLWDVEGVLDLEEPFRVWFQDIDRSIEFASSDPSRTYEVKSGRIALDPRLVPGIPDPSGLADILQR